jgi:hypothetical protein
MTMDFIIKSKDGITGRTSENRYPTEEGFRAALKVLFADSREQFFIATLQDGSVIDEATARGLAQPGSAAGVSPIGGPDAIGGPEKD